METAPLPGANVVASPYGVTASQGAQSVMVDPTDITFSTNSIPRMVVLQNGTVGIGQTTPSSQLHVTPGVVKIDGSTSMIGFNDGYSAIQYNNAILPNTYQTGTLPSNGLGIYGMMDGMFGTYHSVSGVTPLLNWNSSGRVGIGTIPATTGSTVTVQGSVTSSSDLSAGNVSISGSFYSNYIVPGDSGSNYTRPLLIQAGGTFTSLSVSSGSVFNSNVSASFRSTGQNLSLTSQNLIAQSLAGTSASLGTLSATSVSGSSLTANSLSLSSLAVSGSATIQSNLSGTTFTNGSLTTSGNVIYQGSASAGATYVSGVATVGSNALVRYPISQSQFANLSIDNGTYATGPLLTGTSFNSSLALSWASSVGYVDSTGGSTIRSNDGSGIYSTVLKTTLTSCGIGGTPYGVLQVNVGGSGSTLYSAMGYNGYPWSSSVLFGTATDGIGMGYLQSSSSGIISCGGTTSGPNSFFMNANTIQFNNSSSAGSSSTSIYINSAGSVGIGTNSPAGILDVYGKVYSRGTNSGISFQGITPGQLTSYYLNGYLSSSTPSPTVIPNSPTILPVNSYYDMGGIKWIDTTSSVVQTDLAFMTKLYDVVSETMRLSTVNGVPELQIKGLSAGGQLRMIQGLYGSLFRNDNTNTKLLITNSGNQYGTYNSLQPFSVSNSTGVVTSINGQSFLGGTSIYGCTVSNTGTTTVNGLMSSSATTVNTVTVSGGLTADTLTMQSALTCPAVICSGNLSADPGKLILPSYYTVTLFGSPLLLAPNGSTYSPGYGAASITSSQYAYLSLNWEYGYSTNGGTSPIQASLLGTTTSFYKVNYTGIYSFSLSLYGGNSGQITAFMTRNTPCNGTDLYGTILTTGTTDQRKINLSWTGILNASDNVIIGVLVNSGIFIPGFRCALTITNLQ
jgi:hypothetical protein